MAFGIGEAAAIGAPVAGAIYGLFQDKDAEDRRQIEQQKKLTKIQQEANEDAANRSYQRQLDMWNATNYGAQREHLEAAGLNAGLLYGMKGGGGVTTGSGSEAGVSGGQAANAAATQQNKIAMGMQLAQAGLIAAQTEKTKAETENITKGSLPETQERTKGLAFENEVNRLIGEGRKAAAYDAATDKLEIEAQRANADWEAYVGAGFKGKTFNDPDSPIAKALSAGWEKTVEELKQAKTQNNIMQAEQIITDYKANLAKEGISPDSPWYVKILGDLLQKLGFGLGTATDSVKKITQ